MKIINTLFLSLTLAALTTSAFAMKRGGDDINDPSNNKRRKLDTSATASTPTAEQAQTPAQSSSSSSTSAAPTLTTTNVPTQTTTQSSSSSSSPATTLTTTMASSGSRSSSSASSTQSTTQLLNLPRELILSILGDLDGQGLSNAAKTCRALNTLFRSMQVQINRFDRINPSITYMEAARHGNIQLFRMLCPIIQLIEQGKRFALSQQDVKNINTIFEYSILNRNINFLPFLLRYPKITQVITPQIAQWTLYNAMRKGFYDLALLILNNEILYTTIFNWAPYNGNPDGNYEYTIGESLIHAAQANRADIVQRILKDGYQPSKHSIISMFNAAQQNNSQAVIHLLQTHPKTRLFIPGSIASALCTKELFK
jgi:hypothetical protein